MTGLLHDLRYALRQLRKSRGFTAVAVITLALGIGANTAIFSVIQNVLLRPLPFHEPNRLFMIWAKSGQTAAKIGASGPEFEDYQDRARSFEYLAELLPRFTFTWTGQGEPRTVICTGFSHDFFPMLGVQPLLGRLYSPDEYTFEGVNVVISYRFWKGQLSGDPHVIGRTLNLDGESQAVIGVMPPLPDWFPDTDIWAKIPPIYPWMHQRGNRFLTVAGRLRAGITRGQAENELAQILRGGAGESQDVSVELVPLKDDLVGKVRPQLELTMAAVALVLLITCANVAYLLLARSARRRPEMALRLSMGATPRRILRQFITENLLLSSVGGILGLLLAVISLKFFVRFGLGDLPRSQMIGINAYALGFTLLITGFTSLLLAWVPSVMFAKLDLNSTLKTGRGGVGTLGKSRLRALLVSEVSLSVVLLVAAGLLTRSFWKVARSDPGFQSDHLLTVYLRTNDWVAARPFFGELLERTATLPRVQASAISDCMPAGGTRQATLIFDDRTNDPYAVPTIGGCWVGGNFFRAVGTLLLQGRSFTVHDNEAAPAVVIVNKAMAQLYWPGQNPIGKHIAADYVGPGRNGNDVPLLREVVGVVANVKVDGLDQPVKPLLYMPYLQDPTHHVFAGLNLFVRTTGDPNWIAATIRTQIHAIEPNQPIRAMQTMDEVLSQTLAPRRFSLVLFGSFAALALLLSAIGLYGVMAYSVAQRTHEIGIRMALGAQQADVLSMILQQGVKLAGIGIGIGLALSLVLTRFLASLLYGVKATDPVTFAVVAVVLIGVALLAGYIPARRAAKVDPMVALRYE